MAKVLEESFLFSVLLLCSSSWCLQVTDWMFLGPFPVGMHEVDGSPIDALDHSVTYPSEISTSGSVRWHSIPAQHGKHIVPVNDVDWQSLVQGTGGREILQFQGVAKGTLVAHRGTYSLSCTGGSIVDLIGDKFNQTFLGNLYSNPAMIGGSFSLKQTKSLTIYIHVKGNVQTNVGCTILPMGSSNIQVFSPLCLPDLIQGKLSFFPSMPGVVPVLNANAQTLVNVEVQSQVGDGLVVKSMERVSIAPGQVMGIPFLLECNGASCEKATTVDVISSNGTRQTWLGSFSLHLEDRKEGEAFLFTFVDHDGSIAQAGAVRPRKKCRNTCPVVLSFHGTGVLARDQASAYKFKKGKVFGVDGAWVLAPTRHGAHNWEHSGMLTAKAALRALARYSAQDPKPADIKRLLFAGHSMGFHGALLAAEHDPDAAFAVNAASGWSIKEHYGDSNVFQRRDVSRSWISPMQRAVLWGAMAGNDVEALSSNLKGSRVHLRVGEEDVTVHPSFVKRVHRVLKEENVNVTLEQVAGKGHWWWDSQGENDGGILNDAKQRAFFRRSMAFSSSPSLPQEFVYRVGGALGSFEAKHGLRIMQLDRMVEYGVVQVDTSLHPAMWAVRTNGNVRRLQFEGDVFQLMVDGDIVEHQENSTSDFCLLENGHWEVCSDEIGMWNRGLGNCGPMHQVITRPFVIVVGTQGTEEENKEMMQMAVFLANSYWYHQHSVVTVLRDVDVHLDEETRNIIVLGLHAGNKVLRMLMEHTWRERFPLLMEAPEEFVFGSSRCRERALGLLFLAPHPSTKDGLVLVVSGTDMVGMRDVVFGLGRATIPPMVRAPYTNQFPDYMITRSSDFRKRGLAGVAGMGFWTTSWEMDPRQATLFVCK